MTASGRTTLLELRLLVGVLGEKAHFGWWPTSFYEAMSPRFLEPVFGATTRLAQYHGASEAARRVHDEHLNVGAYHLFRLPEEVEQDLHGLILSPTVASLHPQPGLDDEGLLAALKRLAAPDDASAANPAAAPGSLMSNPPPEGPLAIGPLQDLEAPSTLARWAGAYWSAFSTQTRSYPYLVG